MFKPSDKIPNLALKISHHSEVVKNWLKSAAWIRKPVYGFLFWFRGNEKCEKGSRNRIEAEGASVERCHFDIHGSDNQLIFRPGCSVKDCRITVYGDHHRLIIEEGAVLTQSILWFEDHHTRITIGANTTMQRYGHIAVTEPYRKIEIGPDCMFSFNVDIRNGDSHTIFEQASGQRVNWAKNIKIGNHVWLGAHAQVMGGADIGENSIIGLRALVNGKIPANVIAVGSPARVAKTGFSWDSVRWKDGDPHVPQTKSEAIG
jgi:acetyltransferase-like isoleucine patch superfamily enzyme